MLDSARREKLAPSSIGGQISGGQPVGGAGGFRHVIEATRQIMGRAAERQVAKHTLGFVNG